MMNETDDLFYSSSVSSSTSPCRSPELSLAIDDTDEPSTADTPSAVLDDPLINSEIIKYKPIDYHWFYTSYVSERVIWLPMSFKDSKNLEAVYKTNIDEIKRLREGGDSSSRFLVAVKGGRFDVDLVGLVKNPVYWSEEKVSSVRRCMWFYKESNDQRFLPYEEDYSEFLEAEYERTIRKNSFHKRIDFRRSGDSLDQEAFVFHSNIIMLHFTQATMLDEFGNLNSDAQRPRVVKRGLYEVVEKVEPDENEQIDHICFVVHGIGEGCDLKFRPIVECVDDFREIGSYIIQAHLKPLIDSQKINGRVEFLPIAWHEDLHGNQTGVDEHLRPITLPSIPKLREFSNSTILDVLFYTSPIYCQTIINKVGNELNRLKLIFCERNPHFSGTISLVGHSLGSLICFDLLSNQVANDQESVEKEQLRTAGDGSSKEAHEEKMEEVVMEIGEIDGVLRKLDMAEFIDVFKKENVTMKSLPLLVEADLVSMGLPIGSRRLLMREIQALLFRREKEEFEKKILANLSELPRSEAFTNGLAGTGQILVKYPRLNFKVAKFFALGSPIPMFQTVRGIEKIEADFKFPTCDEFFNIFHPFDPVAYRFEPLVCPSPVLKPVLMPHHKGRKRMHIELREGLTKVGGDMMKAGGDIIKNAWSTFSDTQAFFKKLPRPSMNMIEATTNLQQEQQAADVIQSKSTSEPDQVQAKPAGADDESQCNFGRINKGKRIDYVLQESPFESFNDYLFALASHACYWESEDTLLLIVKQLYGCEDMADANVDLSLSESQQQATSWLTQVATQALSSNVQKTFSYFQFGIPSLTNVLPSGSTASNK